MYFETLIYSDLLPVQLIKWVYVPLQLIYCYVETDADNDDDNDDDDWLIYWLNAFTSLFSPFMAT